MSQKPALDDEWDTPGEAVHAVRELIEREEFSQALDLVYVARDEFPRNRPLALLAAKIEQEHGTDLLQKAANWDACIRLHEEQSRPVWFRHLITAVRAEYGQALDTSRPDEHMRAAQNIIELGAYFWPLEEEQELDSEAPADPGTEALFKLRVTQLRFLTQFFYSHSDFAKANEFEQMLFKLPLRLLHPKVFATALWHRRIDHAELADPSKEDILALGDRAFPVSLLASTDDSPEGKRRKRACETYRLGCANDLIWNHQFGPAVQILDAIQPDATYLPEDPFFQKLADARAALLPTGVRAVLADLQPYEGNDLHNASLLVARNATPNQKVAVVFCGGGRTFGMVPAAFHPILKAEGCHVVYVMDSHGKHFFAGQEWRTPSELQDKLEAIISDLGGKQVYTIGWSSGGGAAMRLGKSMGVDGILAFSPVIVNSNTQFAATRAAYREVARIDPDYVVDVPTLFASGNGPNPTTMVFFGDDADQDRRFAERICDLDNVSINYLTGLKTHSSVQFALGKKLLPDMIATLLESKP